MVIIISETLCFAIKNGSKWFKTCVSIFVNESSAEHITGRLAMIDWRILKSLSTRWDGLIPFSISMTSGHVGKNLLQEVVE